MSARCFSQNALRLKAASEYMDSPSARKMKMRDCTEKESKMPTGNLGRSSS